VDADLNKYWLQFWSNIRRISMNRCSFAAKIVDFQKRPKSSRQEIFLVFNLNTIRDSTAKTTKRRERGARRVQKMQNQQKITLLDAEQAKNLCGLCALCVKRP